jgi:hypothetical protein
VFRVSCFVFRRILTEQQDLKYYPHSALAEADEVNTAENRFNFKLEQMCLVHSERKVYKLSANTVIQVWTLFASPQIAKRLFTSRAVSYSFWGS